MSFASYVSMPCGLVGHVGHMFFLIPYHIARVRAMACHPQSMVRSSRRYSKNRSKANKIVTLNDFFMSVKQLLHAVRHKEPIFAADFIKQMNC